MPPLHTFPTRLRSWRDKRQLSNGAAAQKLSMMAGSEVSTRTFENWIQGRRFPHPLRIAEIEKAIAK